MNALFSAQTNDRTFDTAVNGQTYTAYNDKYKDTQNSLPENIFEKEITQVPQETLIDFSEQKYNKEITINPLKEDITQKAYNQTDIQMANKYNPVLQKDSELLREQRAERTPELMQGHVAQTEGTNPIGDMAILNASQNAQAATRGSLKMMMNRHQYTPRGVDPERWRQEMPDYNYIKQGQEIKFGQQGALYSWNQSQLMNNSENSIQKRQIPNVRLQNQGAQQVMYGMRKAADTTMVSTQKNDIKQRYNIQGNQLGMLPHQVKKVKANEIIQFYQPVSNYQLNAMGQYIAPTKIVSNMNVGRNVAYNGDTHVMPSIQPTMIPTARKRQTNGGITIYQNDDKFESFNIHPTVNYTRNYKPTATQLNYIQEQPDVYFTQLAQVTNDTMSRGSPMTIGNLSTPLSGEMNVGLMI